MKSLTRYPHKNIKAESDVKTHDYIESKPVVVDDIEIVPWTLYSHDDVGNIENYPTYVYTEYSLYIYNQIMAPQYYTELFHIMRNTAVGDIFHIYINSPGGDMTTLQAFGSVLEEMNAYVCCHVDGEAGSAAFVLSFMGDDVTLSEFSQLMTHNQHLTISRTDMANIKKYTDNSTEIYRKMLEKYCLKILTHEEIESICNDGREIHLSAHDAEKRLEKWHKEHQEDEQKEQEPFNRNLRYGIAQCSKEEFMK